MADQDPPPKKCTAKRKHVETEGQGSNEESKKKKARSKGPAQQAPQKKKAPPAPPQKYQRKKALGDKESGKVLAAISTYLSSRDKTEERLWDEASCSWHVVPSSSGGQEESAQMGRDLRDITPPNPRYNPVTAGPLDILRHMLTYKTNLDVRLLKPTTGSDISDDEDDEPVWFEAPDLRKTVAGHLALHMRWEEDVTQNRDPRFMRMMRYLASVPTSDTVHLQHPVCATLVRDAYRNRWGPRALTAILLHMSQVRNFLNNYLRCVG